MRKLTTKELRNLFIEFFKTKDHAVISSASLIPENDPSVLFTTAGMHPLVPYLLGEKHPAGKRLVNVQKCVRTGDIDDVGDTSHLTFFEMLGNWSLGDYFKKEAIEYSYEFLTSPDWLGIDKDKLYFTVFAGDEDAPKDVESYEHWLRMGVDPSHIFFLPKKNNWWFAGPTGPCGPDTEIFYDTGIEPCCTDCSPACSCGKYLEIWNNVFMEYNKTSNGFEPLSQKNVDTGMGLERTVATLQGVECAYDTDAFSGILKEIETLSGKGYRDNPDTTKAFRIIADHIRCATFILGDPRGVTPSNVDQGYVLRRLIRRALRYAMQLEIPEDSLYIIAEAVINQNADFYTELETNRERIITEIQTEEKRFQRTLKQGMREFEKMKEHFIQEGKIDGKSAFRLYDTFGFPIEFTQEMASEIGLTVDIEGFNEAFAEHQKKSQIGADQKFKGGLADSSEQTTRLHTATHLLQAALRKVLDESVSQRGSNITPERLRFDFSFDRKVTREELDEIERLVNEAIQADVEVICEEKTVEEALNEGAIGLFGERYGERVKVYTVPGFSKEICGGPHVKRTGELGTFKIVKEEASSAGVRRIKAVLK
ncbi:MAG TPA: alanine--tRNA ligase [Clostridiales bacterium]|nr:alanine--tRNA ligase [Clostridiales bacterium]